MARLGSRPSLQKWRRRMSIMDSHAWAEFYVVSGSLVEVLSWISTEVHVVCQYFLTYGLVQNPTSTSGRYSSCFPSDLGR